MGEARRKALAARRGLAQAPAEPQVVDTLGWRMHVRWDEAAARTTLVPLARSLGVPAPRIAFAREVLEIDRTGEMRQLPQQEASSRDPVN